MIKDTKVGDSYTMSVVVLSSTIRTTKGGKPYLDLEVFDGEDSINGKIWDWAHANNIEKNAILDLKGTMSEYLGNKQLAINSCDRNKVMPLETFAPKSPFDPDEYLQMARDMIKCIEPPTLQQLTLKVFLDHTDKLLTVPGAKKIHHAFVAGTLVHLVGTAVKALALARTIPEAHHGLTVAGALLHDIGKLYTYKLDGVVIELTPDGESFDHIALGLLCLNDYKTTDNASIVGLIQHIIASHHGKQEYGSPVTPNFLEAWIINYADGIDARAETIRALTSRSTSDYTEKEWSLENKRMVTCKRVREMLGEV
jgi:3'-5' exoribonuclease